MALEQLVFVFIALGAVFLVGLATDLLGRLTRLPRVTLLLIFGVVLGPSALGVLQSTETAWVDAVSVIALVMVGFLLGEKLTMQSLREHGMLVLSVSLVVTLATILTVFSGLLLLGIDWQLAALLGAMATATDPAATIDVIREARARGRFTQTLMGVVAIDDVWGLLGFSLILTVIVSMSGGQGQFDALASGLWDIGGALAIGLGLGVPMALLTGRLQPGEPTQAEALGAVFLCAGVAMWLEVSSILAAMVLGMTVANLAAHHKYAFSEIEGIEWPFLILFFVLAGASLDLAAVQSGGLLLAGYILLRVSGRVVGGWLGASLGQSPRSERLWYGTAMLPQAGVAIGMALLGSQRFPEYSAPLLSIAIAATVFFELLGPILTRIALQRVGEVQAAESDTGAG